jgi:hypothetical protein
LLSLNLNILGMSKKLQRRYNVDYDIENREAVGINSTKMRKLCWETLIHFYQHFRNSITMVMDLCW